MNHTSRKADHTSVSIEGLGRKAGHKADTCSQCSLQGRYIQSCLFRQQVPRTQKWVAKSCRSGAWTAGIHILTATLPHKAGMQDHSALMQRIAVSKCKHLRTVTPPPLSARLFVIVCGNLQPEAIEHTQTCLQPESAGLYYAQSAALSTRV